jgi:hypothetical protein
MSEPKWRVVDTPLLQPWDEQKVIFSDRGPWCYNLKTVLGYAQWMESLGRDVWVEGIGHEWLNSQGIPTQGPPQYYHRKPK